MQNYTLDVKFKITVSTRMHEKIRCPIIPRVKQILSVSIQQELSSCFEQVILIIYYFDYLKDLDNIKITDETINAKIENLIELNDSKVLWFIKNSKAGIDASSVLHFAAKHFRYSACEILIDGVLVGNLISYQKKYSALQYYIIFV